MERAYPSAFAIRSALEAQQILLQTALAQRQGFCFV